VGYAEVGISQRFCSYNEHRHRGCLKCLDPKLIVKDTAMLKLSFLLLVAEMAFGSVALAQVAAPPATQNEKDFPAVTKMMGYGKKQEGKVFRDEVTDERLLRLFDLADTEKAGVVTKEQLVVAATKLEAEQPQGGRRGRGEGGGPGGGGPGGRNGFGGRGGGGRPPLGVIMPRFVQEELTLSESQRQQVADLQKELDTKLDSILTDEQRRKYKDMKENPGRGGPNGRGPGDRGPGDREGRPPE
jgi:hypothetical protein